MVRSGRGRGEVEACSTTNGSSGEELELTEWVLLAKTVRYAEDWSSLLRGSSLTTHPYPIEVQELHVVRQALSHCKAFTDLAHAMANIDVA